MTPSSQANDGMREREPARSGVIPPWFERALPAVVTAAFVAIAMTLYFALAQDGRVASSTRLPLDALVPLLPGAAWIYVSPYFAAPLLLARLERAALWRVLLRAVVVLVPSLLCFFLVPTLVERPDLSQLASSPSVELLRFVYRLDAPPRNAAPSGHVSLALVLAWGALQATRAPLARALIVAYASLVVLSTLFSGQHHLLDVVSGALLALLSLAVISWLERHSGEIAQRRGPEAWSSGRWGPAFLRRLFRSPPRPE